MKVRRKCIVAFITTLALVLSIVNTLSVQAAIEDVNMEEVFSSWINYPDESIGGAYSAGWSYDATNGLYTTENVGWTGFYNPNIENFTTGVFEFQIYSRDTDPLGFTWGMQTGSTNNDPTYSFYAFEECGHGNWSIAYIDKWSPTLDTSSHRGPLYHNTIDASDRDYAGHSGGVGTVGFATGTVLAHGTLPTSIKRPNTRHNVKIVIEDDKINIYLNDEPLVTVDAPVQSGSFGPYAVSNPDAHIYSLSYTTTDEAVLAAKFEYHNENGYKTNEISVGDYVAIEDLSTYDISPIISRYWIVYKDGSEIYSGSSPYTEYSNESGTYETILVVANDVGMYSEEYRDTLIVSEKSPTISAKFEYQDDKGTKVNEINVGDSVTIKDLSFYEITPIEVWNWTVLKDGVEIYSGTTPYAEYRNQAGTYITTLVVINELGIQSEEYSDTLVVKDAASSQIIASASGEKAATVNTGDINLNTALLFTMLNLVFLSIAILIKKRGFRK